MTTINFLVKSTNYNNGLSKLAPPISTINFEEMIRSVRGKPIASYYYQTTVTAPDQTLGRAVKHPSLGAEQRPAAISENRVRPRTIRPRYPDPRLCDPNKASLQLLTSTLIKLDLWRGARNYKGAIRSLYERASVTPPPSTPPRLITVYPLFRALLYFNSRFKEWPRGRNNALCEINVRPPGRPWRFLQRDFRVFVYRGMMRSGKLF